MTVGRVVVSALLPQGYLLRWWGSLAEARTSELCDTVSVRQFTDVEAADYAADTDLNCGQMASFLFRLWRDTLGIDRPKGEACFIDTSIVGVHTANDSGLWMANADGTNLRQLLDYWVTSWAWSPDGTGIAYEVDDGLWVVDTDGTRRYGSLRTPPRTAAGGGCENS